MIIKRLSQILDKTARFVSSSILLLIFLIVFMSAVLRYVFKINILSSYDWVRVMFVWLCFIGTSVVYKMKEHSNFTFLYDRLKGPIAKINEKLLDIIALAFFCIVAYSGVVLALAARAQKLPASGISAFWLYFPISIGSLVSIVHALSFLIPEKGKSIN